MKKFECLIPNIRLISVNERFLGSPKYINCKEYLAGLFQIYNPKNIKFSDPVHVIIFLKTRKDIDNNLKVIFDALQVAGILADDNLITGLSVSLRRDGMRPGDKDTFKIIIKEVEKHEDKEEKIQSR